jgi:hypothetical protein
MVAEKSAVASVKVPATMNRSAKAAGTPIRMVEPAPCVTVETTVIIITPVIPEISRPPAPEAALLHKYAAGIPAIIRIALITACDRVGVIGRIPSRIRITTGKQSRGQAIARETAIKNGHAD